MTRNSVVGVIVQLFTSGKLVIGWSCSRILGRLLYSKSPIARDKFRFPSIRPSAFTKDPAFVILYLSRGFVGLWSKESGVAFLLTDTSALESPAFAQIIFFPPPGSGTIKHTFAVQPLPSMFVSSSLSASSIALS